MEQNALADTLYLASLNARRTLSALQTWVGAVLRFPTASDVHCAVPGMQAGERTAIARAEPDRRPARVMESSCILNN